MIQTIKYHLPACLTNPSEIITRGLLTKRETEVLKHVGLCLYDKEICDALSISQNTLRSHKDSISLKMGIVRKTALGILAHKLNLI